MKKKEKKKKKKKKHKHKLTVDSRCSPCDSDGTSSDEWVPAEAPAVRKPVVEAVSVPSARTAPLPKLSPADIEARRRNVSIGSRSKNYMAATTPAEYAAQQSVLRKELDPETGRVRLVKGTGEIIEEIVSKSRQQEINREATRADGASFQRGLAART